jgi:hypothetical protein
MPRTAPLTKCQKINKKEDPNIHCLRAVLGGKSLVSCVFGSRFDVAGAAGACLKRYTNPSFFKLEWAKSELRNAQHDKKANLEKVKSIFAAVNFLSFLTYPFVGSVYLLEITTQLSCSELVDGLPTQPVVCMLSLSKTV